jgi:hypothetical protein
MVGVTELNTFLINFANSVATFIPNLIAALIILIVGYIVGRVIGLVIEKICIAAKIDKYVKLKGFKLSHLLKLAGEWTVYLVFIQSAAQYLGIIALAMFVNQIVYFIPKAAGAAIIVVVGYILGNFFEEQIKASEGVYKNIIGKIVNFFTVYVAIALALPFLGIDPSLVNSILLIIIGSFGLGFAIALGLGLKDIVAREADKYIGEFKKAAATRKRK